MSQINLQHIKGKGFLTFYDPFEFLISNYQGQTVQIDGWNKDDAMSKSNGSGKSSLLEAISWVLYGELCRKNHYKDEVIYNRNGVKAKFAQLEAEFNQLGNSYRIERKVGWKKSPDLFLWVNGEEILKDATPVIKQQHLENILGMNFTAFQYCEMFGRDFMSFPDLKPADRAKVLTDIRKLDKYVEASKICNEEIKKLQSNINFQQEALRLVEGKISQLRETNYKDQIQQFEEDRKSKLSGLKNEQKSSQLVLSKLKEANNAKIEELKTKIKEYTFDKVTNEKQLLNFSKIQTEQIELEKQLTKLQSDNFHLSQELKTFNQELINLQKLGVGKCPVCHQPITAEHVANEMYLYDKKSDEYNQQIKNLNTKIVEIGKTLAVRKGDLKYLESIKLANEEYQALINKAKLSILDLERNPEEQRIQSILDNILRQQKTIQEIINPYEKQEENRKTNLFALVGQTKSKKQEIENLELESKYYLFWVEGFKKIRMALFGTIIDCFQEYAQILLSQYSSELQIQFFTERETRSGTIKDEFNISITDSSGTTLSYEMYSGGEKQKIRLVIALALAQMIKDDCGREFNFITFDEPNDALDEVGKEINFEVFSKLAGESKIVLVTDHDALFKDKFDHSILVVKEKDKSRIQYDN